MQTHTGRTPSEWIAIHEEELRALAVAGRGLDIVRAIDEHHAAISYWRAVRARVHAGGRTPSVWEDRARRAWRQLARRAELGAVR